MDFNIRKAVISNLSHANSDAIRSTIADSMTTDDEKVLPGLGVLFEAFWKAANEEEKNLVVNKITNFLN